MDELLIGLLAAKIKAGELLMKDIPTPLKTLVQSKVDGVASHTPELETIVFDFVSMRALLALADKVEANLTATRKLVRVDELSPAEILELKDIYPDWKPGLGMVPGHYYKDDGKLYRVNDGMAHTSQADWKPSTAKALFTEVMPPSVIPLWTQPTGAHDAPNIGDKRIWPAGGKVWTSKINGNTTIPDGDVPYNRYWTDK